MTDLQIYMGEWGVLAVFVVALAEFAGVPIAAVPFLVAAGVLAPQVGVSFVSIVAAAAIGAVLGDTLWYWLGRTRSKMATDRACGLTSYPWACVTVVRRQLATAGASFFVISKLIPGIANLVPAAAGLGRHAFGRFIALDAVAALLWATAWCGVGWVGSGIASRVQSRIDSRLTELAAVLAVAMVLTAVWRVHKMRLHKGLHVRDGGAR